MPSKTNSARRRRIASFTLSNESQDHITGVAKSLAGVDPVTSKQRKPNESRAVEAIVQHHKNCKFAGGGM